MRAALSFLIALVLCCGPGSGSAAEPPAAAIERADRLEDGGDYAGAISAYLAILKGNEAAVLWRISRAYSDQGEVVSPDQQVQLYDLAIDYGRRAVQADPQGSDSHALLAVALGKKALFVSGKEAVNLSKEILAEGQRAIALDPKNFIPYIVLGIWNREVANLNIIERAAAKILYGGVPKASMEASVDMLRKAISLRPDSLKAHLELGLTYAWMGEKENARAELTKVIEGKKVRALDDKAKAEARAELAKLR